MLDKIELDCAICNSKHEIELREYFTQSLVKGQVTNQKATYYYCNHTGESYASGKMVNENLTNAKNAYLENNKSE